MQGWWSRDIEGADFRGFGTLIIDVEGGVGQALTPGGTEAHGANFLEFETRQGMEVRAEIAIPAALLGDRMRLGHAQLCQAVQDAASP